MSQFKTLISTPDSTLHKTKHNFMYLGRLVLASSLMSMTSLNLAHGADEPSYDPRCRPNVESEKLEKRTKISAMTTMGANFVSTVTWANGVTASNSLRQAELTDEVIRRNYLTVYFPANDDLLKEAEKIAKQFGLESTWLRLMQEEVGTNISFRNFVVKQISKLRDLMESSLIGYDPSNAGASLFSETHARRIEGGISELSSLLDESNYVSRLWSRVNVDDRGIVLKRNLEDFHRKMADIDSMAMSHPERFIEQHRHLSQAAHAATISVRSGPDSIARINKARSLVKFRRITNMAALGILGTAGIATVANYAIERSQASGCPGGQSIPRPEYDTSSEAESSQTSMHAAESN